ncbi:hypothetical protein GCM10025855_01220 [Shewanella glacialipiscicola]|uniref:Uncharacterized protein n=1 Tax=Shewanella glacialipiscicola TaxID=614069 RepID=A0ABQ6IZ46_9GAMM|nr:hypothetical protein GCM10025855_01220 [Shewanella glacialipiscicola]
MGYSVKDLIYQGEKSGVHNWQTLEGSSFYWHPDWLHIAEDITGYSATATIAADGKKRLKMRPRKPSLTISIKTTNKLLMPGGDSPTGNFVD